jgi:ribosomal protein S6
MIDIRQRTALYVQQNFEISPDVTEAMFDIGLIREDVARRVIIREEYLQRSGGTKKTDLKLQLAEKFCTSVSTIEKIVGNEP